LSSLSLTRYSFSGATEINCYRTKGKVFTQANTTTKEARASHLLLEVGKGKFVLGEDHTTTVALKHDVDVDEPVIACQQGWTGLENLKQKAPSGQD